MNLAVIHHLCSILTPMTFLKTLLMLGTGLVMVFCDSHKTYGQECVFVQLSESKVCQRVKHWSGLRSFAKWSIVSCSLGSCANDGLVPLSLKISTPDRFSGLHVRYDLELVMYLDGASGAADKTGTHGWKSLAVKVKAAIRKAEKNATIRRFVERFAASKASLHLAERADHLLISYEGMIVGSGKVKKNTQLVYDRSMQGGFSSFSLPHGDSLPVLPSLLRMMEVVSSRYPNCQVGWVDGSQTKEMNSQTKQVSWRFSVDLDGAGCPGRSIVTLAPDKDTLQIHRAKEPVK